MRILFVGMVEAVHTARWISQIVDQGWDVFLFPVARAKLHPAIPQINVFNPNLSLSRPLGSEFHVLPWVSPYFFLDAIQTKVLKHSKTNLKENALAKVIRYYKPDLIHSLEMQHAGYLTLAARDRLKDKFPKWAMTIWGSDIYLFSRIKEHKPLIYSILKECDYFGAESERDINLARKLGLKGQVLPVLPATGGVDLKHCENLKSPGLVSERRTIILKGYQHFAGRALVGLRALALCADLLKDYRINIFGASPDVTLAAELFSQDTKIPIDIISGNYHDAPDDHIFKAFGNARIAIGLSISDGLPRALIEAMVMGAYPIQSGTASADEWIVDGQNGSIVPPEDPEIIAKAIRNALTNDALVNNAADINAGIARERLDKTVITPQVVEMYKKISMDNEW
jgi:glycosyltransferase involved in cell wall biosynthesis